MEGEVSLGDSPGLVGLNTGPKRDNRRPRKGIESREWSVGADLRQSLSIIQDESVA